MSAEQPAQRSREEISLNAQSNAAVASGHLSAGPLIGVLFALAGGALAWTVLQAYHPVFGIPTDLTGGAVTAEQDKTLAAALANANQRNTMLALAVVGSMVGGALGIAEGVARRSWKSVIIGFVVAAVFGVAAGVVGGLLGDLTYVTTKPPMEPVDLSGTVLIQSVALSVLGAGIGLGLGASTGRVLAAGYCLSAGLLAGVGAGLLFPIVQSFALPGAQTQLLVPLSAGSLLLWIALIAGLLGLIVPGTAAKRPPRSVAARTPATTNEGP